MFIIVVFLIMIYKAVGTSFLFRAHFTCFHTLVSLITFSFCFFVLFHSCCSHARLFGKTLVHEFLISYSHTEWYLLFYDRATTSAQCVLGSKTRNS